MVEIEAAVPLELNSLEDLIKWIVSSPQGQQTTLFYYNKENEHYFSTLIILPGYYQFKGLPILLVAKHFEAPKGSFLRYF